MPEPTPNQVPALGRMVREAAGFVIRSAVRVLAVGWLLHGLLGLVHHGALPRRFVVCSFEQLPGAWALVATFAGLVLARGIWHRLRGAAALARLLALVLLVASAWDSILFYRSWCDGRVLTGWPVPLSLWTASILGVWAILVRPRPPSMRSRNWLWTGASLTFHGALAVAGIALLVVTVGAFDERTEADAVVVFGAGVDGRGRASLTLLDRTRTGSELVTKGYAARLVLSGGHGVGVPISEPDAMQKVAREAGVPADHIFLDPAGENTAATVRNAYALARANGWRRLLWVSHDYHLARIRFFAHDPEIETFTVPARETRPIPTATWSFWREVAALTVYWLSGRG